MIHSTPLPADTPHVPAAIIGAGACGLVTALSLRDADIECVLLERDARPSGSTALSSGLIPACNTRVQRAAGITTDSVERFSQDIQNKAHGQAAPHLVAAYTRAVGPAMDMLGERHGLQFHVLDGFLYPSHSVLRMHAVPEKTGAALVAQLEQAARSAGADIVTQATVRQLWVDARQRVTGVAYERPDGRLEHLACDVLVLACNGFGGNPAMVAELLPEMAGAPFVGHTGNDGSAIAWGRALGARLADLSAYQGHGSWAVPHGTLITWALMGEGALQLNARGERFLDESGGYSEAAVQVLAQPGGTAWDVFDGPLLELGRTFPDFVEAEAAGAVKTCADLQALATLIGADVATVERSLASGHKRTLQTPFHAVKVTGALFHTQGGLDIDRHCRVLREDGTPLPNLLAAGGAARGVSGNAVWGYLSGNGLLSAVGGGAIAGRTAVEVLQA
ncbi:MAG: FAD-dependent oxidoreductase [Burkholderiaceae bacterium]